jgi:hypothetical protein
MAIVELQTVARLIAATTNHLRVEGAALGPDGVSFHPAAGEWCANEIVGHLIEADRRGFTGRLRQILASERPDLLPWDQEGVAAGRADCSRSWDDVLEEFVEVRREGLLLLEELTIEDLDRVGLHPEVGELAVRDIVYEWPFHDRDHLRQMLTNARHFLWPRMGNTRGFSTQRGAGPS